jgi:hypothetical protein
MIPHAPKSQLSLRSCRGPSAPWPTFAQRERKKMSAIPVGMTEKANSLRAAPIRRGRSVATIRHPERSSPIFSFAL